MPRYLSLDWIEALGRCATNRPEVAAAATGATLGITQVVVDGPDEGEVTYHVQVADGTVRVGAGPADPEDVRLVQDYATAVAVATGELNAQEAFLNGRIRLHGDQAKLLAAVPVFSALDPVFAAVRPDTTYDAPR